MADSVKKKIMTRLGVMFDELKTDSSLRYAERTFAPPERSRIYPSAFFYEGIEKPVGADTRGRSYRFPLYIDILFRTETDLLGQKDDLTALVQDKIESDLQLSGLGVLIEPGEEIPLMSRLKEPAGGVRLVFPILYRRERGNAAQEY